MLTWANVFGMVLREWPTPRPDAQLRSACHQMGSTRRVSGAPPSRLGYPHKPTLLAVGGGLRLTAHFDAGDIATINADGSPLRNACSML